MKPCIITCKPLPSNLQPRYSWGQLKQMKGAQKGRDCSRHSKFISQIIKHCTMHFTFQIVGSLIEGISEFLFHWSFRLIIIFSIGNKFRTILATFFYHIFKIFLTHLLFVGEKWKVMGFSSFVLNFLACIEFIRFKICSQRRENRIINLYNTLIGWSNAR